MMLRDGTIVPSYYGTKNNTIATADPRFANMGLRFGEVREIIYRDDPRNISKKYTEYRVGVQYQDGKGHGVVDYPNCYLASIFGGVGDKLRFTHREKTQAEDSKSVGEGSKVLIACIDGDSHQAVIVGGLRDSNDDPDPTSDEGHHLLMEFNGARLSINSDGEPSLTFRGATDDKGKLLQGVNQDNSGTLLTFTKNGDAYLQHNDQILHLDHQNQAWKLEAVKDILMEVTDGKFRVNAKSGVEVFTSDKGAEQRLGSDGIISLESNTGVQLGLGIGQEPLMMGRSYRNAQTQLHQTLTALLTQAAALLTAAGTAMAVPVTGAVAAGPQIVSAATAILQAVNAIQEFEAQSFKFLSTKNTTD